MIALASFVCGLLFGLGLIISDMSFPPKVLNFLDVFGTWDPTLLVVMAAALAVSTVGFRLAQRRAAPVFEDEFRWPSKTTIDQPLLVGALLFGIGWGMVGLCPGPALVNLATLSPKAIVFVVAMAAGMYAHERWAERAVRPTPAVAADG